MAPVQRKLKSGKVVYWVALRWMGKNIWRKVGASLPEAEDKEARWKKQITEGTFDPNESDPKTRVSKFAAQWLDGRKNRTAGKDRSMWRNHVESTDFAKLEISMVRAPHTATLVESMKDKGLSDKSVANVLGMLHTMFRDAEMLGLTHIQPVKLPKNALKRRRSRDPDIYQPSEALALMLNRNVEPDVRMLFTLLFYSGMRQGEAHGRRWRDLQPATGLKAMHVRSQYDGAELKTNEWRTVPIHSVLESVLEQWASFGFQAVYGRNPQPDDFIVPSRTTLGVMTRSVGYKRMMAGAKAAGVKFRGVHATRHTFITIARRGGAVKDSIEQITHNSKGDIVDGYTRTDWEPLCEAMSRVVFDSDQKVELPDGNGGKSAFLPQGEEAELSADLHESTERVPGSIPRASTRESGKTSGSSDPLLITSEGGPGALIPSPSYVLAGVAHRLGVLPDHVVTESDVERSTQEALS